MPDPASAHVICILPKLGSSVGGGKINAIFTRMNLLADKAGTEVTLLNLTHGCAQRIAFAELVAAGVLDPRVGHRSILELCAPPNAQHRESPPPHSSGVRARPALATRSPAPRNPPPLAPPPLVL